MRDIKIGFFRVHPAILVVLFVISFATFFLLHLDDSGMSQEMAKMEYNNAMIDQIELLIENPEYENYLTAEDIQSLDMSAKINLMEKYGKEAVDNFLTDVYLNSRK